MTNIEKQERYRKKEALKKMAGEIAMRFDSIHCISQGKSPAEFQKKLESAVDLPYGWTDEDYEKSLKILRNLGLEFYDNPNLLHNDIEENHDFANCADPRKFIEDVRKAESNSIKLMNHILSAVELSGLSTADAAAVLLDVQRALGRILVDETAIPKSNATAWTLATMGPQYEDEKPEWFEELFGKALKTQLGIECARRVGTELSKIK